jgi:hypothetical protein
MSEHTGLHQVHGQNEGTRVTAVHLPKPRLLGAHDAFIVAYDRLSGLASIARNPAVLVAAVDSRARVVEAVILEAGESLIIGRHTQCDLRLEQDTIALRHLAAHAAAGSPSEAPTLRLWDLNTGQPFLTEDGQPNAAVITQGTLYAAVGEYALLFVPTPGSAGAPWPARAEEAWKALPPREFIDRRTPQATLMPSSQLLRSDGREYETDISRVRRESERTSISRVGPLWMLGDEGAPGTWGELLLVQGAQVKTHGISLEHLEQGVLLGRYERCGISLEGLGGLSRVHLLLVRSGDEVLAIDTASTNGTWRGKTEIRTSALQNPDALMLGSDVRIHWRRLPTRTMGPES